MMGTELPTQPAEGERNVKGSDGGAGGVDTVGKVAKERKRGLNSAAGNLKTKEKEAGSTIMGTGSASDIRLQRAQTKVIKVRSLHRGSVISLKTPNMRRRSPQRLDGQ